MSCITDPSPWEVYNNHYVGGEYHSIECSDIGRRCVNTIDSFEGNPCWLVPTSLIFSYSPLPIHLPFPFSALFHRCSVCYSLICLSPSPDRITFCSIVDRYTNSLCTLKRSIESFIPHLASAFPPDGFFPFCGSWSSIRCWAISCSLEFEVVGLVDIMVLKSEVLFQITMRKERGFWCRIAGLSVLFLKKRERGLRLLLSCGISSERYIVVVWAMEPSRRVDGTLGRSERCSCTYSLGMKCPPWRLK